MANITGISFSHAENSMNTRGLSLMGLDYVYDMTTFNIANTMQFSNVRL